MLSSVPLSQISCGASHVGFLTAFGQVYTFGGSFSLSFSLSFSPSFSSILTLFLKANDVFQCGLGEDSLPYIEEPTLVSTLVQVCSLFSPLLHTLSFPPTYLISAVKSHIYNMWPNPNSSHCRFILSLSLFSLSPPSNPPFSLPSRRRILYLGGG